MNKSKRFDALLKRYQEGKATDDEKAAIESWLDQYPDKDYFGQLSDEEQNAMLFKMDEHVYAGIKKSKQAFFANTWFRAAAALLIFAIASVSVWKLQHVETIRVATFEQTEKVILPDGSIIWLKENSTLSYPDRFKGDTRRISFSGEALFEVAKDKDHPFIIQSGDLTATVLGTSFNIKTTHSDIEVTVLTGKVSLVTSGNDELVVKAHEKAIYKQSEKQLERVEQLVDEAVQLIAGTEYDMQFHATRMSDVFQKIERKFDVTIILADASMNNCLMTGDFTDQSLEETLAIIRETLGFTSDISRKRIDMSGEGCD